MKSFVSIAIAGLSLVACSNFLSEPNDPEVPIIRLRAEPYQFATFSGFAQPARFVVRDSETWRSTWSKLHEGLSPMPPVAEIDFSKEAIVVVALGTRGSSGYDVILESAFEDGSGGLIMVVHSTSVGNGCAALTVLTQPVDVARIPNRYTSVQFVDTNEVVSCGK